MLYRLQCHSVAVSQGSACLLAFLDGKAASAGLEEGGKAWWLLGGGRWVQCRERASKGEEVFLHELEDESLLLNQ